jgi:5'-deoxynucleotidase YfbR-like HD superfamily hydrolase
MLAKTLRLILEGGHVERFHTVPTHLRETVGHHSFCVAWLTCLMSPADTGPSVALLMAALQHDIAEVETGDIPAPFKRRNPAVKIECDVQEAGALAAHGLPDFAAGLTDHEAVILKLADSLAGMAFCLHERKLGSRHIITSFANFSQYVYSLLTPEVPVASELYSIIMQEWNTL